MTFKPNIRRKPTTRTGTESQINEEKRLGSRGPSLSCNLLCGEEGGRRRASLWQEFCSPRQARTCRPFFPPSLCASSSLLLGRKARSWEIKGIARRPHERQRFGGCVKFPREAFPVRAARSAQTGATRPRGREGEELASYERPRAKVRWTFRKFAFLFCSKLLPKNVKVRLGGSVFMKEKLLVQSGDQTGPDLYFWNQNTQSFSGKTPPGCPLAFQITDSSLQTETDWRIVFFSKSLRSWKRSSRSSEEHQEPPAL